jgi:uncharacterized protein (DUF362 family)
MGRSTAPPATIRDHRVAVPAATPRPVSNTNQAFAMSGIDAAARQAGARVIKPRHASLDSVEIPGRLGRWSVLEPFVRATKLINVPVVKHHHLSLLSAGMKNLFGGLGSGRKYLHQGIDGSIAGVAALFTPTVTIVDATRVLFCATGRRAAASTT